MVGTSVTPSDSPTASPPIVGVSFEGPGPQRRLTVAFRIILAIPHFLYAWVLGVVAILAMIVGWFVALFTGRLPRGIAEFLAKVVQYVTRVFAYGFYLLTDRYPSFELGRPDYAVSVDIPSDVRLNRAAVLFRLVLLIPIAIVVQLLGSGLFVVAVVTWLLVLMLGRLPVPLFEALASILRYEVRYYAFAVMLTSEYPRGLFGDKADGDKAAEPPAEEGSTDDLALGLPPTPRITRLVLSRGAKWIIGLTLAVGVVVGVVGQIFAIASDSETANRLEEMYSAFEADGQEYTRQAQGCAVSAGGVECLHQANRDLADSIRAFRDDLRALKFAPPAIGPAEDLDDSSTRLIDVLDRMATVTDPAAYQQLLTDFQAAATDFDDDFNKLYTVAALS